MTLAIRVAHERQKCPRGFTLIELMIVVVLLGIAGLVILPEMKGVYQDALLRSAGRELLDAFHLAYSRAVSLNRTHRVRIEESSRRYFVEQPAAGGPRSEFSPVREASGMSGELDERISVRVRKANASPMAGEEMSLGAVAEPFEESPPNVFSFYADGTADGGEVILRDRHGYGLRLQVDAITARVRVREMAQP